MNLVCSWEGGGRRGVIEVCAEIKKKYVSKYPSLVQHEGMVVLAPGPSWLLLPPHAYPFPCCLILLSWKDLDCYSEFYCYLKGKHLCLV